MATDRKAKRKAPARGKPPARKAARQAAPGGDSGERVRTKFHIKRGVRQQAKIIAAERGITLENTLSDLIEERIGELRGEPPAPAPV